MAQIDPIEIQIGVTDEITKSLKAIEERLSEARIRAIVREELVAWEKQQVVTRRIGWHPNMETK